MTNKHQNLLNDLRKVFASLLSNSEDFHSEACELISDTDYDRSGLLAESQANLSVCDFRDAKKALQDLDAFLADVDISTLNKPCVQSNKDAFRLAKGGVIYQCIIETAQLLHTATTK